MRRTAGREYKMYVGEAARSARDVGQAWRRHVEGGGAPLPEAKKEEKKSYHHGQLSTKHDHVTYEKYVKLVRETCDAQGVRLLVVPEESRDGVSGSRHAWESAWYERRWDQFKAAEKNRLPSQEGKSFAVNNDTPAPRLGAFELQICYRQGGELWSELVLEARVAKVAEDGKLAAAIKQVRRRAPALHLSRHHGRRRRHRRRSTAARQSAGVGDGDGEASPLPVSAGVGGRVVRESRETFGTRWRRCPTSSWLGGGRPRPRRLPRRRADAAVDDYILRHRGRSCTLSLAPTSDFNALKTPLEKSKLVADEDNFKLELKLEPRHREFTLKIVVLSKDTKRRVGGARVEVKASGRKTALCDLKTTTHTASATPARWPSVGRSHRVDRGGRPERRRRLPARQHVARVGGHPGRPPAAAALPQGRRGLRRRRRARRARGGAGGAAHGGAARATAVTKSPLARASRRRRWRQAVAEGRATTPPKRGGDDVVVAAPRPPARNDQVGD